MTPFERFVVLALRAIVTMLYIGIRAYAEEHDTGGYFTKAEDELETFRRDTLDLLRDARKD